MKLYCLDTNFFINTWKYYSPDIVADFRIWIEQLAINKEVFIPSEVYDEISIGNDDLAKWLKNIKEKIVLDMDEQTQDILVDTIMKKEAAQKLADSSKKNNAADLFVIACAYKNKAAVITNDHKLRELCSTLDIIVFRDYEFLKEKGLKMKII
jgi:predicted nucleic acid-binding protein